MEKFLKLLVTTLSLVILLSFLLSVNLFSKKSEDKITVFGRVDRQVEEVNIEGKKCLLVYFSQAVAVGSDLDVKEVYLIRYFSWDLLQPAAVVRITGELISSDLTQLPMIQVDSIDD